MLESRNYYMNEKVTEPRGWSAIIRFVDGCGVNRGCTGFSRKYEAQKWLDENLDRILSYDFGELEFAGVEKAS